MNLLPKAALSADKIDYRRFLRRRLLHQEARGRLKTLIATESDPPCSHNRTLGRNRVTAGILSSSCLPFPEQHQRFGEICSSEIMLEL